MEAGQVFNGTNRKNINKNGDLTVFLYPGDCANFTFTSSATLDFSYLDFNECSDRGTTLGAVALDLDVQTILGATNKRKQPSPLSALPSPLSPALDVDFQRAFYSGSCDSSFLEL